MAISYAIDIDDLIHHMVETSREQLKVNIRKAIQAEADKIVEAAANEITQHLQTAINMSRDRTFGGAHVQLIIMDKRPRSDG